MAGAAMYPRALDLGKLLLTNSADQIQLSVISTACIQLPPPIATSNHTNILKALTSGHIWTSRGIDCSLEITVLFNGKPLDKFQRSALLDNLGRHLRDAKIWPQLSLLPCLETSTVLEFQSFRPDISIAIKYGPPPAMTKTGPKGWLLDKTDVIPPKDVLRADVERIQLQMEFLTIASTLAETQVRIPEKDEDLDLFLLDQPPVDLQTQRLVLLEDVVKSLKYLPHSIGAEFGSFRTFLPSSTVVSSSRESGLRSLTRQKDTQSSVVGLCMKNPTSSSSRRLPKQVIDVLERWLESNASSPFPTETQKQEWMRQTGLKRQQLNSRLRYSRRKLAATSVESEQEMLFSIPLGEDEPSEDDDPTDLLSQFSDDTPLLSQPSTISTAPESLSVRRAAPPVLDETIPQALQPSLDCSVAGKLVDAALQALIGGYYPQIRLPYSITIEKSTPERTLSQTSLSQLAPTMFNPGYRQLIAHNSRFLPTITNALSISLPKNVQSPTLRKKLEQLATLPLSPLAPDPESSENLNTSERISRIVQTRLFSMMQRTLYDPSTTRKIFKKSNSEPSTASIPGAEDSDSSPDLLDEQDSKEVEGERWDEMLAQFTSDDEFNDLLGEDEDEDEDLLDEVERERLAIEKETDEMLFGDGWGEEEDDDFLLSGGESEGEGMLL